MLSQPTTDQIIADCRNELLSTIDAAITDPAVKIAIQMMENVLRNCATRAAHEIAWMREEIDDMITFAERVAASTAATEAVAAALSNYVAERSDSLHLDDVSSTYSLAGECLSAALEAALAAGDDDLSEAGRALLAQRLAHETEIMGEWTMVGRG
jgi:hypothetical protein